MVLKLRNVYSLLSSSATSILPALLAHALPFNNCKSPHIRWQDVHKHQLKHEVSRISKLTYMQGIDAANFCDPPAWQLQLCIAPCLLILHTDLLQSSEDFIVGLGSGISVHSGE